MKDCNLLFSDIELKNADTNIPADDHIKNGIDICTQLRKNGYQGDIIFLQPSVNMSLTDIRHRQSTIY